MDVGMHALSLCSWVHLTSVFISGLPSQNQAARNEQVLQEVEAYKHLSSH